MHNRIMFMHVKYMLQGQSLRIDRYLPEGKAVLNNYIIKALKSTEIYIKFSITGSAAVLF